LIETGQSFEQLLGDRARGAVVDFRGIERRGLAGFQIHPQDLPDRSAER